MKAVILAGGQGTRISEETDLKPKPMIEIGGKPLLWHIMKIYDHYNINEFIICLGVKGYIIKEFFLNYYSHLSDITVDLQKGEHTLFNNQSENWKITLIDTGPETMTGGRIKKIIPYVNNETFLLTYGDGFADINISDLITFHYQNKKLATVTAVRPPGRFGVLSLKTDSSVCNFNEKPSDEIGWINGGYFVLEPDIIKYIDNDQTIWEQKPLQSLAKDNQLMAYKHYSFWKPCDTLRDKRELENLWMQNKAPWKIWS